MSETFLHLKLAFRDNLGSALFLLVTGTIAIAFIGYLLIDYFRTLAITMRMKRHHRRDAHQHEHRHS